MTAPADPADPKDGPDSEEGGIPAAYTYFGQFIDHDLTFDPASSLQKQNDVDALVDYRTPQFDLDNIYGRGPDDQPYMYMDDGRTFVLGTKLTGADDVNKRARDVQRNTQDPARALINDEVGPLPIFKHGKDAVDLRGFKAPKSNWALDWRRFIDLVPLDYGTLVDKPDPKDPRNINRLQLAYRIDTSLVNPLGDLP